MARLLHAEMTAWRQDIHAHPELGFQEDLAAGHVAAKLEALCLDEVHHPAYDFDGPAWPLGAAFFARAADARWVAS